MELRLDVLMVDDDHNDLAVFGIAVDRTDLNIWLQTLTTGRQAIDYLKAKEVYTDRSLHPLPDLVMLDLKMPQMSGFDFLAWRKPSPLFSSIPVVVLSTSSDQAERKRALDMGADKYLVKPFDLADWENIAREIWDFGTQGRAFFRAKRILPPGA